MLDIEKQIHNEMRAKALKMIDLLLDEIKSGECDFNRFVGSAAMADVLGLITEAEFDEFIEAAALADEL